LITGNFPPFAGGKLVVLAARVRWPRDKQTREIITKPIKILLNAHLPWQNENMVPILNHFTEKPPCPLQSILQFWTSLSFRQYRYLPRLFFSMILRIHITH
jgi:hypothetical protein